jgi:ATP synthase protein I
MPEPNPPPSTPPGSPDRLDTLKARIDAAQGRRAEADLTRSAAAPPSGLGVALRVSTELFAGVVVGGGLGWFLDRALGSSPIGLVIFILIGFAAGTMNLIRNVARGSTPSKLDRGDPRG